MARYPLGGNIRLSTTVKDLNQTLTDPSTIVLAVRAPDGTTISYSTPTHDSVGNYHQDIPAADLTQIGRYVYTWTTTGTAAGVIGDLFDVFDPLELKIISLADAKNFLDIPLTDTDGDDELQAMIATADEIVSKIIGGPILTTSVTERVQVGQNFTSLAVRQRPLVSVTSITDTAAGVVMNLTDLDVDPNAGIIRRNLGLPFFSRGAVYSVVYKAGLGTSVPAPIELAAKIIVGHMWDTQRGPSLRPTYGGDETVVIPGMGYAVPNRAVELLAPYAIEAFV